MGYGSSFHAYDDDAVRQFVGRPWSDGESFSEKIWKDSAKLAEYVNGDMAKAIVRGDSWQKLRREIATRFEDQSASNIMRVVQTEGTYVARQAQGAELQREGFEDYFVDPLDDSRTCASCRSIGRRSHDEPFRFDEAEVGVNYPPLHPRCRCFVNPAVEDWGEWARKRREERRQAAVSEETVARRFGASTGAGAGALNDKNDPYQKRRDTHAINYYEEVRNRNPEIEISAVSRNSGVDRDTVRIAYQHIFVDEHELDGVRRRFDPSYDMAQSWQRLRSGKGVQKHDRTLLMHEAIEARLMADGMSYESAHAEACRKGYNYQKELDEWLTGGD